MPISTSPYKENNYQAASTFQPYKLPSQEIARSVMAQNQFWMEGASRVKNVYDDALGLKLSLEPNKQIRDNYVKEAEKQLTKLSSMDLADPSVQRQGFNLFKPLFKDEGILYDDLTTKHYEQVRADALNYRQKDNGKGYSDVNMAYAMDGYGDFVNSQDRMAGKKAYEKRRDYTPYYDYTLDFDKALKTCHPSSQSQTSPQENTGYSLTTSSKFLSASQTRLCIESGLSGQGQRQLQIEGAVNYKNNKEILASDTEDYLGSVSDNLSGQLQQLAASKHSLEDPKSEIYSKLKPDERKLMLEQINQQMDSLSDEISSNNLTVGKLKNKDYSLLDENYDGYAGSVYTFKKLYRKALASAYEESNKEYKADPRQVQDRNFLQQDHLRNIDFRNDVSLKQMGIDSDEKMKIWELMYGGAGKGSASNNPFKKNPLTGEWMVNSDLHWETPNIKESPDKETNVYNRLQEMLGRLNKDNNDNNLNLYNSIIERGNDDPKFKEALMQGFGYSDWNKFKADKANNNFRSASALGESSMNGIQDTPWFESYFQGHKDDSLLNTWADNNSTANAGINALKVKVDIGEKQVAQELGGDYRTQINTNISKLNPIKANGIIVTPQDIQAAIEGSPNHAGLQIKNNSFVDSEGNLHHGKDYYLNGKLLPSSVFTNRNGTSTDFGRLIQSVDSINGTVNNKINEKRKEVYDRLGFNRERWATVYDDKDPIIDRLKSVFAVPTQSGNVALNPAIAITGADGMGGIKISIPGEGQSAIAKLRTLGIGEPDSIEMAGDGAFIFRKTGYASVPQAENNPMIRDVAYQLSNMASTTAFQSTQIGSKVEGMDIKVPVYVSGKRQEMIIKTYKNGDSPEFRAFITGATNPTPKFTASNPYELFEKLAQYKFELNQPIR